MNKKTLTVIIPTWNRARYLEKNLEILDSYLQRGLDFKILVCNNGSTDNTPDVLKKYENHPNFRIINHQENIKYDRNVASGYLNFDTDYCACFGDTKTISFESMKKIIKTINEEDIDAIVINSSPQICRSTTYYNEINSLLSEIGWALSNINSSVIHRSFISKERCERYYDSLFIHMGVFIDALCFRNDIRVKYDHLIVKETIYILEERQPHGWLSNACKVWGKYWLSFILSLPWQVTLETKLKVIQDANKYYRFLSPGKFVYAKINCNKDFIKDYRKNRQFVSFVSSTPLYVYDIISLVPSFFYQWMRPILKMNPKYGNNISWK